MVELTPCEQTWLKENYPELSYDSTRHKLSGKVGFSLRYEDLPVIKDSYVIKVDFSQMKDRLDFPSVYNTDHRILNAAKRKHKPYIDFHIGKDGKLCMILPCKLPQVYPNGFNIQDFMSHLCNHLYWVSFYELYDKEPWTGEKHGDAALIEYARDYNNINLITKDRKQLELFRVLFKKKYGKGIAINKLKNKLLVNKSLFIELINSK
jgi:hypothetical protein